MADMLLIITSEGALEINEVVVSDKNRFWFLVKVFLS